MSFSGSIASRENVILCLKAIFNFRNFALLRHLVTSYRQMDLENGFLGVDYLQLNSKKLKLFNFVILHFSDGPKNLCYLSAQKCLELLVLKV